MSKKINLTDIETINDKPKKEEKIDLSKIGGLSKKKEEPIEEPRKEYCITIKPSIYEKFREIARREKRKGIVSRDNLYLEKCLNDFVKAYEKLNGEIKL